MPLRHERTAARHLLLLSLKRVQYDGFQVQTNEVQHESRHPSPRLLRLPLLAMLSATLFFAVCLSIPFLFPFTFSSIFERSKGSAGEARSII